MAARTISANALRADCTTLERAVLSMRLATKEALAPHRPGGASNPARDAHAWLAYYRHLHRTHARADAMTGGPVSHEAADAAAMDALRAEPVRVRLLGAKPDDPPIFVYAKSLDALLHVHALDRQLAYMTEMHARLCALKTADAVDLLPRVLSEITYTYRLLCWIVTSEGPQMPYDPRAEHPEPPAWILALEPWDVIRICEAHHKHLLRVHAVSSLIDQRSQQDEPRGTRPSWSMFAASASEMFATEPRVTMRDRALSSLLAATWLANAAKTPPDRPEKEA